MKGRTLGIAGAVVLVAIAAAGLGYAHGTRAASAASGVVLDVPVDEIVRVVATPSHQFSPPTIEVTAGKLVRLDVQNADAHAHTLTYDDANGRHDHALAPGSTTSILVRFDAAGSVPFWCVPHSGGAADTDPGSMRGAFVVRGAGA